MRETFEALARRYGRTAVCHGRTGEITGTGFVFLQPMTEKIWQRSAGALGAFRQDRFLCLAPEGLPLGTAGEGSWLECGGEGYVPITVQTIYLGEERSHQWAVLRIRDGGME